MATARSTQPSYAARVAEWAYGAPVLEPISYTIAAI